MTSLKTFKTIALTLAASASALTLVSAPSAFAVEQRLGGVIGCDAAGSKQEVGAVIGGLLGAVAGRNLAKNERGAGTAIGAVAGAGAGSYVGCKMQKKDARQAVGGTYKNDGIRFADSVQAAPVTELNGKYVARSNLNLRASASTRVPRWAASEPARPSRLWAAPLTASGFWWARTASALAMSAAPMSIVPNR